MHDGSTSGKRNKISKGISVLLNGGVVLFRCHPVFREKMYGISSLATDGKLLHNLPIIQMPKNQPEVLKKYLKSIRASEGDFNYFF